MSNLEEGTYLIKFIVDGRYECNPNYMYTTDSFGNINNVIKIEYEESEKISMRQSILRMNEESLSPSLY